MTELETTPSDMVALIARARRQTLGDLLRRSAARYSSKLAIACGEEVRWTYGEFNALCDDLAAGLQTTYGIQKGTRIAVLARNSHWFAALRFAVARAGAVLVPINFMLNHDEVAYILEHSGAEWLCSDDEFAKTADAATQQVGGVRGLIGMPGETSGPVEGWLNLPDLALSGHGVALTDPEITGADVAQIIYTSGTESRPKGALLTHDAVIAEYNTCVIDAEIHVDDTLLHALPLYHCAQLDVFLGPAIYVGATNVITGVPSPDNIIELIQTWGISSFFAPPTVWIAILAHERGNELHLNTLKKGYYGASIMPVEVLKSLLQRLPALKLWNLYGQTEIARVATILRPHEQLIKAGSAGRPALNVETRVVNDAGNDVAVGEVGEVVHRSPQLLSGYFNNEEKTAESFIGGWFHSGDLATIDAEGYITIVDRKKDMIKSGGENVASREVEETLYAHPAVEEVAVIGTPDVKWIEAVTAVVVRTPGHDSTTETELIAFCADRLAGFKVPKRMHFVPQLPKNPSGKVLKRDLRERFS